MTPCAFFDGGICIETMEAHITKGLELIEGLYISRNYGKFLGKLLGIAKDEADELLKKSYVIHDVGKCLEEFQQRRAGFKFHEFYSALVAREVFKKFGDAGDVATVAVFLHHHNWIRGKSPERPKNLTLSSECVAFIEEFLGEKVPQSVPWVDPKKEFYPYVERVLGSNLRAVYALLLPIAMADNYAAHCNRKGKASSLSGELFEALDVRGWDVAGYISRGL
ncbi:MAG: CRISPR-associated endonuclease Cas3-HD [Thermococcaceae archaeon]|jgi:CRISPR-associated endonuclease Cas3-HD|uniref:CRISPR-associated endonuclease Cas3'' n=2 Tax=Thermococcus TaxID=2263 RepID=UPI0005B27668|nr:HD domain-containing protein [Thermococcus bergensis]KUK00083.1 MAG: Metal-dependent phosphohydrolase, HD superfamily [Thermococcales archaeon 44_46]MDK2853926.1 CRISPR-associated endonuclease Cas3-HD [Thermococcaceae archaeon]MCA6214832.1 HD domain-containing protein [Thermococcus bergensis]MDK2982904.1 CRISPR-associated endonuclease Cas3-HD [Thermococcaceae archaeon]MDN5319987.1 CRISPR-associated endonuclease Cas3-HD [Thermococcaceae archaeon]